MIAPLYQRLHAGARCEDEKSADAPAAVFTGGSPMLFCAALTLTLLAGFTARAQAQSNPLWHEEKIKNFLPHMTSPEVRDLLTRTDIVIIPVPSIEQHRPQPPTPTDYYARVEQPNPLAPRPHLLLPPVLLPC